MQTRGAARRRSAPEDDLPEVRGVSWPEWLGQRMSLLGYRTSSDLARAAEVPDSVISRWRSGSTTPSLTQLRRLQVPLRAPLVELLVAAGLLTADEARLQAPSAPQPEMRDVRDAIERDPVLTDDLKHLLQTQYDAMVALARAREDQGRLSSR
jgi:transcriptional regulator with XRE-family HTH domain